MKARVHVLFVCISLLCAAGYAIDAGQLERGQQAVERLNLYRRLAGLPPVTLDETLSAGCIAHANYLNLNKDQIFGGLTAHDEYPDRPGYTEAGKEAGINSDIFYGGTGTAAVDGWYETYYHRSPMLSPGVEKVGYGDDRGSNLGFEIVVLQFFRYTGPGDILSPAENSMGNAVAGFGEVPEPVPGFGKNTGNPIIAYFGGDRVTWISSTVTANGSTLEHTVIAPNKPSQSAYEVNEICLITKAPLPKNASVDVSIVYTQGGTQQTKAWTFFTSSGGKFDAATAGGGASTPTGTPEADSDGDGFLDAIEVAAGTDPSNAGATPFGGTAAGAAQSVTLSSVKIGLNFIKDNSDSISVAGALPLPDGTSLDQQQIVIDVGGVARAFTIDAKGKGTPAENDKFKIGAKAKDGVVKFSAKFSKGTYRTQLADENLTAAADIKQAQQRMVKISITFRGVLYENSRLLLYTSAAGKKGSAK